MKLGTAEFLTFVALFLVEKIDGDGVKKLSVGFGKFELRRSSEPSDLAVLTRLGSTEDPSQNSRSPPRKELL